MCGRRSIRWMLYLRNLRRGRSGDDAGESDLGAGTLPRRVGCRSLLREVQELADVLVPHLLRLRVRQRQAQLVDHFGPVADRFAPAGGADVLEDLAPEVAAEGLRGKLRPDLAAALAVHL